MFKNNYQRIEPQKSWCSFKRTKTIFLFFVLFASVILLAIVGVTQDWYNLTEPPTAAPTISITNPPSASPTILPTKSPSNSPSASPSLSPSNSPSFSPTKTPSVSPSNTPSPQPSASSTE